MGRVRIEVPSDTIDVTLHVKDSLVYQPVSEFNTGIRQGNASNDDRNLASFYSFEDARGGIGTNIGDIREDVDKLGDSDGLLTHQFNLAIKPPTRDIVLNGAGHGAAATYGMRAFESDYTGALKVFYQSTQRGLVYHNTDGGGAATSIGNMNTSVDIVDAIVYRSPVDGDEFLMLGGRINGGGAGATTHTYGKNTATATTHSDKTIQSFVEFDGKVFGAGHGELFWTIDPEGTGWIEVAGTWPYDWQFIGVFPFGDTYMPYAITNPYDDGHSQLIVVDVDANRTYPLRLGVGRIDAAVALGGEIGLITESGYEVIVYEPFRRAIRDLDWGAVERNGFDATNRRALARDLLSHRQGVVVLADLQTSPLTTQMFMHRGTGWHPYGKALAAASGDSEVYRNSAVFSQDAQLFWLFDYQSSQGSPWKMNHMKWFDEPFTPGTAQTVTFEDDDMAVVHPWLNMGFSDLPGIALVLQCGGWFDATHKVKIEYQIDFDDSSWTTLGTFPGTVPGSPEITNRTTPVAAADTLVFDPGGTLAGVAFQWIRFRVTLQTTSGHTISPNAYPLTLRFLKRPNLRDSIRFEIDWQRTRGANPDLDTIKSLVNTLRDIYNATTVPKVTINEEVTYAAVTSYPRVPVLGPSDKPVASDVDYEDAVLVFTMAELL
jgi:hypothetical protein